MAFLPWLVVLCRESPPSPSHQPVPKSAVSLPFTSLRAFPFLLELFPRSILLPFKSLHFLSPFYSSVTQEENCFNPASSPVCSSHPLLTPPLPFSLLPKYPCESAHLRTFAHWLFLWPVSSTPLPSTSWIVIFPSLYFKNLYPFLLESFSHYIAMIYSYACPLIDFSRVGSMVLFIFASSSLLTTEPAL